MVFLHQTTDVFHQLILYVSSWYTYCLFILQFWFYLLMLKPKKKWDVNKNDWHHLLLGLKQKRYFLLVIYLSGFLKLILKDSCQGAWSGKRLCLGNPVHVRQKCALMGKRRIIPPTLYISGTCTHQRSWETGMRGTFIPIQIEQWPQLRLVDPQVTQLSVLGAFRLPLWGQPGSSASGATWQNLCLAESESWIGLGM